MSDSHHPPAIPPQPATPPGAPPVPTKDEMTMGMLCHLLGLLTGFVGPLIIWLVKKDDSPFIDHHGKESLNFQITLTIAIFGLTAVAVVLSFIFIGILLFPVIFVVVILALVAEIMACLAASRGEWNRYPGCIRFIA